MPIEHLPADSATEKIYELLESDGCVVLDRVLDRATIASLRSEFGPHLAAAQKGKDEFDGLETKRIGTLIARSRSFRRCSNTVR